MHEYSFGRLSTAIGGSEGLTYPSKLRRNHLYSISILDSIEMVGYRVRNHETFDRGYICPKCLLLLRNTVQFLVCGHRQCQSCVDEQQP